MAKVTNTTDRVQYVMATDKKRVMLAPRAEAEIDVADTNGNRALIHVGAIRIGDRPAAKGASTLNPSPTPAPRRRA